jgi:hypothetical protein
MPSKVLQILTPAGHFVDADCLSTAVDRRQRPFSYTDPSSRPRDAVLLTHAAPRFGGAQGRRRARQQPTEFDCERAGRDSAAAYKLVYPENTGDRCG